MALKSHFELDPVDRWEVKQSLKKLDLAMDKKEKTRLWAEGKDIPLEGVLKIAMGESA